MAIFIPTVTPTITPVPTPIPPIIIPIVPIVHSPIIAGFDIRQLVGLGGVTFIEAFIKYLQNQWRFPKGGMAPVIASLLFGVALNTAIAYYLHLDITNAIVMGVITGVGASGYHQYSK